MQVESIAEWSKGSILQYFWPALSDNQSKKNNFWSSFEWPLKTGFTVILCCFLKIIFVYANTVDPDEVSNSMLWDIQVPKG